MSTTRPILQFSGIPEGLFRTPLVDLKTGMVITGGAWAKQFQIFGQPAVLLSGTHAQRASYPAASFTPGSTFRESDRLVTYVAVGANWIYAYGVLQCTQATLPIDLGANDIGLLANVTDFAHLLQWTGTSWSWGPGDAGSDYYVTFRAAPLRPGWHAADGSEVQRLNMDGSILAVTVANTPGSYYRQ